MKEYQIHLKDSETLKENEQIRIVVMDQETMEWQDVRATVSSQAGILAEADKLWLYAYEGHGFRLSDKPWYIKILEKFQEETPEVRIKKQKTGLGRLKGSMLESLLSREKEE